VARFRPRTSAERPGTFRRVAPALLRAFVGLALLMSAMSRVVSGEAAAPEEEEEEEAVAPVGRAVEESGEAEDPAWVAASAAQVQST
jgi:Na+-transporting methylmalonyl-CoA/oxaloacetate decarboxylase gamma subunit